MPLDPSEASREKPQDIEAADGADATLGAKADTKATNWTAAWSLTSLTKALGAAVDAVGAKFGTKTTVGAKSALDVNVAAGTVKSAGSAFGGTVNLGANFPATQDWDLSATPLSTVMVSSACILVVDFLNPDGSTVTAKPVYVNGAGYQPFHTPVTKIYKTGTGVSSNLSAIAYGGRS